MADPERFYADPDPTFQADADPDLAPAPDPKIFVARERKKMFFQIFIFFFSIILQNLSGVIYSVTMREEGQGVSDEAMRGEG